MLPKRYYARKRLDRAACGHKSCEKRNLSAVDIFDTKVDLNPPPTKFSWLKLDILTKLPVNNFSFAREHS